MLMKLTHTGYMKHNYAAQDDLLCSCIRLDFLKKKKKKTDSMDVVCWFLNVPATCYSISETDLLRQLYVLPHWDRSSRPNFPSHTITVCWHRANQSQRQPYNVRRLTGLCLLVACLTSQKHASVSQGRICSDKYTSCHTEIEADQTLYLTQSQYTDTGPTSPSADPITPGAWQGSHWSVSF